MRETWKRLGRYDVSDLGRVRHDGRICKQWYERGHWFTTLWGKHHRVSRLVARAFLNLRSDQWVRVKHGTTPRLDNLVVCSSRGEQRWTSKLRQRDVLDIYYSTKSISTMARKYAVSNSCVAAIRQGHNWAWLTGAVGKG